MSRRFFLDIEISGAQTLTLSRAEFPNEHHHVSRVLRAKEGEHVEITNGRGQVANAKIGSVSKDEIQMQILGEVQSAEAATPVVLCQALLKGVKMDWLVEKITEIGLSDFYPLLSERVVKTDASARTERWKRIAQAAIKQSHGSQLLTIHEPLSLTEFLALPHWASWHKIVLHPGEKQPTLLATLESLYKQQSKVPLLLFLGPEGGFSENEIQQLEQAGAKCAQLGDTILRGETAGIVVSAMARQAITFWAQ